VKPHDRSRGRPQPPHDPEEARRAEALAREAAERAGFGVVLARASANRRLRVMLDRPEGAAVTIDDCAIANRAIQAALTAAGLDPGNFEIEVESPGADRPLTREEDFVRFRGERVTVSLREAREGRRNFTGTLVGFAGGDVTVHVLDEDAPETFPAREIREVRLHPEPEKPPPREPRGRR
jgi:ribosome maturation factor RimP